MKKTAIFIAALTLVLSLCACGGDDSSEQQDSSDPTVEANTEDGVEKTPALDGSENVSADILEDDAEDDAEDDDTQAEIPNPVREVRASELQEQTGISFTMPEGAQDVSYYTIDTDGNDMAQMTFMLNGVECTCRIWGTGVPTVGLEDISGMYYQWTSEETAAIGENAAELHWIEGEQGIALWYDYAPGLLYCVAVDSKASLDSLLSLSKELYIPLQGDADGETGEKPGEEPAAGGDAEEASAADRIVSLAESLIGAEYEWGAAGPDTFDNSGFAYYCFSENGINVPRRTQEMFAAGTAVEQEDLLPGDLVFFTYNEDQSASYVGIYVGGGQFIAENNESSPVCAYDMTLDYFTQIYVGARRYF